MHYKVVKEALSLCGGTRTGYSGPRCNGTVYRCSQCGHAGCRQSKDRLCSSQAFSVSWRCYGCGTLGMYGALG